MGDFSTRSRYLVFHDRSKHIDIQYHYAQDFVKERRTQLETVPMKDMSADLLTKSLPHAHHVHF
jgi:hypothetical protein